MRALLLVLAGCATGFTQTISIGGSFGKYSGVVLSFEVSPMLHERFPDPPPPSPPVVDKHGPHNHLGIAAVASVGVLLQPAVGATSYAAAGLQYLPFLYETAVHVGFDTQVGYAIGALHGGIVTGSLRFGLPINKELAGAPLTLGGSLRCHAIFGEPLQKEGSGCGPALLLSRMSL